ncbi:MAG: BMC domain-containing protein [Calditrichia bacterium]
MKNYPAIALIEFNDLAHGITAGDAMVKKAPILMLKAGTISRGKYLVLIGGSTASVKESYSEGLMVGGDGVIDSVFLPDVHEQVHEALLGTRRPVDWESLGILETGTVASIIQAADAGIKGARVNIVEMRLGDGYGGKGYVLFTGTVEEVQAAMDIGLAVIQDRHIEIFSQIIPSLHAHLTAAIQSNLRFSQSKKLHLPDGEDSHETG